jgi:hypothetical protein
MLAEPQWNFPLVQEKSKDIRVREHTGNGIDYSFAASQRDKPMMNDRYPQIAELCRLLASDMSHLFIRGIDAGTHLFASCSNSARSGLQRLLTRIFGQTFVVMMMAISALSIG